MSRKIVWQKTTSSKFPTLAKSSTGGNTEEALKEAIGKITNWEAEIRKLMEKLTEEAVGCASDSIRNTSLEKDLQNITI